MLNQREIKVLHLEPTDVCQAACPLCARETNMLFDKKQQQHLSMDQILRVFSESDIANLDKMFMCGNYGDPAAGRYTLDIYQQFRRINSNIVLGMNSNGALRNQHWWSELANILNQPKDYVVFSIDGLEDTNHIYRVNVNWNQLITNVKSFIAAGGSAHWDMLIYQHNEHQVEQCRALAKSLGFKWFRAKVSRRFNLFPVKFLQPPKNWQDPPTTGWPPDKCGGSSLLWPKAPWRDAPCMSSLISWGRPVRRSPRSG
jgi:MoaA/NifB/PqqE/SkfB family radical SAM enzyme